MSVYEIITSRIIEKLEAGTAPWTKPWSGGEFPKICRGCYPPHSLKYHRIKII